MNQLFSRKMEILMGEKKVNSQFKLTHDFEKRQKEAIKIMAKYPDRVPIICEKSTLDTMDTPSLDKSKFLVPRDLSIGQFLYVIRRRIKLTPEKALFLFINNKTLAPTSEVIMNIYERNKDSDGFLYMTFSGENVFGNNN